MMANRYGAPSDTLSVQLAERGVHGVILAYVDTSGVCRVKTIPTARLSSAAAWGVGVAPVHDTYLANGSYVPIDALGPGDGDLCMFPDLDGITVLAGQPGWAWTAVDRIGQDGRQHPGCGRTFLRRVVAEAAEHHGITFKAAIEVEWSVGRKAQAPHDTDYVPACSGGAFGAVRLAELSDYTADLMGVLTAQDTGVAQFHPETGAAQFEVSVDALDPVAAADRSVLVRQTIQAVSMRHGLRASFSPAVVPEGFGNGGHLHLSAWQNGRNLHSRGERRYGMTEQAEAFVAGILTHLPALTAITAPSPASYLRLKPSYSAGPYTAWGYETRQAALRVIAGPRGRQAEAANVEVKPVDLAANPYLALGCTIAAGLDGMRSAAVLPEEIAGDPARLTASEAELRGVHRLPTSLKEAVEEFRADTTLRDVLGPALADAVIAVRCGEIEAVTGLDDDGIAAAYRWTY
ncbi:glutamine synthetase [Actinosynnema sp. NPDC091369]